MFALRIAHLLKDSSRLPLRYLSRAFIGIVLAAVLAVPTFIQAQPATGSIEGRVFNAATGTPSSTPGSFSKARAAR
jgi:hypothetical protein